MAISQSEAEATTKSTKSSGYDRAASPKVKSYAPSGQLVEDPKSDELAKYMDRGYWEKKRREQQRMMENEEKQTTLAAASGRADLPKMESMPMVAPFQPPNLNGMSADDSSETCNVIQHKLDLFLNRMRSNMTRGRNISQDSAVQSAFQELSNLQPVLAKLIAANEMKRNHFESHQDQLSLMKDTRETLDSMRDDHQEKMRQERMERERQMQMQRQQKMEALRGLKQQFLLHRMQQLETERQNQANLQEMQMQQYQYQQQPQYPGYPQAPPNMMGMAPQQGNAMYPPQNQPMGAPVVSHNAYNMQPMQSSLPGQGVAAPHFMQPPNANLTSPYQSMGSQHQQYHATDYSSMPPSNIHPRLDLL